MPKTKPLHSRGAQTSTLQVPVRQVGKQRHGKESSSLALKLSLVSFFE